MKCTLSDPEKSSSIKEFRCRKKQKEIGIAADHPVVALP